MGTPHHDLGKSGVLRTDALDDHASAYLCHQGEVALFSRRSPAKTTRNEDAALIVQISDEAILLGVADGCGGMPAGDEAAKRSLEALRETVLNYSHNDLTGALLAGFDAANAAVLDMRTGAGTTLIAMLIADGVARMFHVGDSCAIITGQRGRVHLQATPHSPTGFGVEAGLLTEQEAITHEDRSLVLNIVGSTSMSVEISQPVRLGARDTVLLASDGLSDNLLAHEIIECIRVGPCAEAVDALAASATSRMESDEGHPDDLTILAYRPTRSGV